MVVSEAHRHARSVYGCSQQTCKLYVSEAETLEAVPDTDPSDVEVLVTLSNSLLDSLLRTWWLGRLPLRSVEEQVDRAVDVMFSGVSRR